MIPAYRAGPHRNMIMGTDLARYNRAKLDRDGSIAGSAPRSCNDRRACRAGAHPVSNFVGLATPRIAIVIIWCRFEVEA